jgi:hypothetical protein
VGKNTRDGAHEKVDAQADEEVPEGKIEQLAGFLLVLRPVLLSRQPIATLSDGELAQPDSFYYQKLSIAASPCSC